MLVSTRTRARREMGRVPVAVAAVSGFIDAEGQRGMLVSVVPLKPCGGVAVSRAQENLREDQLPAARFVSAGLAFMACSFVLVRLEREGGGRSGGRSHGGRGEEGIQGVWQVGSSWGERMLAAD